MSVDVQFDDARVVAFLMRSLARAAMNTAVRPMRLGRMMAAGIPEFESS